MSNKKRIYVDFDDVLAQTVHALLQVVKREFGKSLAYEDIHSFNLENSFGISRQDWDHLMHLAHQEETLLGMQEIHGASEHINHLDQNGYEFTVVTGRPPSTKNASATWLNKYNIPHADLIFVDKYKRFEANETNFLTLDDLLNHRYDYAVEDSASMAEYVSHKMQTPVFLLNRPWNQNASKGNSESPIMRCESWEEIREKLSKLP
ncbi:hypothetical protein BVY03_06035 [bacterium K02(2017)]|nr:hypothetical protein BVY03_06035 [bacterium K02(2017)]